MSSGTNARSGRGRGRAGRVGLYRQGTPDKRMTEDEVVGELRSDIDDLHLVTFGGRDVGLLCAAGKLRRIPYGFVSLDSIPLEPHFHKARQAREDGMFPPMWVVFVQDPPDADIPQTSTVIGIEFDWDHEW